MLNFIKHEISAKSTDFIQVSFNPWRFTEETALLTSFFNMLAMEINKAKSLSDTAPVKKVGLFKKARNRWQKNKEPLKTNLERLGDLFQKYGKVTSFFGASEGVEAIGKAISNVDIETLKSRIESLLENEKKRIVVYIDDIDRLDKKEIYTIFRLVKLTADFSYTSYLLSFDEKMVAAAIGDRFGEGDEKSGESFLEKVIQVPLSIPKAQPSALKKFCFGLVDHALNTNQIQLTENEVQRFVNQFTNHILPRLETPRLAVRYGNALSFSLPLLNGEVNLIDLMLIEAIKIFFPKHYFFIKKNPEHFIGKKSANFNPENDRKEIEQIKTKLDELESTLSQKEKNCIENLLTNLFPNLEAIFHTIQFSKESEEELYSSKRIASAKYFDRYFTYTVVKGDISDIEFDDFLKTVSSKGIEEIATGMGTIIEQSNPENFLYKVQSKKNDFDWEGTVKLVKAICRITDSLPKKGGFMRFKYDTPFGQAGILIYRLLIRYKGEKKTFDLAKELMFFPEDFEFAYYLNNCFRTGDQPSQKLFSTDQYIELAQALTDRAIEESGANSIFEKFPEHVHFLVPTWEERDKESLDSYIEEYLDRSARNIIHLIKAFIPVDSSTIKPEPFKGDLEKHQFEYISSLLSVDEILDRIYRIYPKTEIENESVFWIGFGERSFIELNMVRQFIYWHIKQSEKNDNK